MGTSKTKSIEEIDDLPEMFKVTEALGISCKGLNSLDQMKAKVKEELNRSVDRPSWKAGQTFQVLSEASKTDARKREILCKLYEEAAHFFKQLEDDVIVKPLQESLGDFKKTLEESQGHIKPRDQYVVLVAGETSAGKSSIINLILGEDLLPHSILSTTSTICEFKYGEKPGMRIHFKGGAGETREPTYQELGHSSATYKDEIQGFVHLKDERDKGSPYKKIEVFWPHPLFQEGVIIVDSPGVGENEEMNKFALSYLPHAFCFIYVIKSDNAGGVQEDRLGVLLNHAKELKKEANLNTKLFTSSALFVCNMWDKIPFNDVEDVKKTQVEKLTKKLKGLDEQSQIIYLSCKNAQLAQTYGVITEDFDQLLSGISNLVVSSMQNSLESYSSWLENLLSKASYQVRVLLNSTTSSRQETEKRMKRVLDRMEELESSQDRIFDELSERQLGVIKEIINKLVSYFKSPETSKRFCEWSVAQVPGAGETWEETKSKVLKCISERAQKFVQEWEDQENDFAKGQAALLKYCTEKYDIMEEEIHKVEEVALCEEIEQDSPTCEPSRPPRSRKKPSKTSLDVSTSVWFRQGLASVVVGVPFFGAFKQKFKQSIQYNRKLQSYNKDPSVYMKKRSEKCLKIIANDDRLLPFITGQLDDAVQFLSEIKTKIPRLRENDKKLYRQLLTDSRSKLEIQGAYEPLRSRLEDLERDIMVFNIKEIRKSDFARGELQWGEDEKSVIGRGNFSTVYCGVLSRRGKPEIKVALKVYSNPLERRNVWHFIHEERALRELRHPNIVVFYGTNLQQSSSGTKVMVILELCEGSLKERILSHPENAPARSEDAALRKNVLLWAIQIIDALRYVHDQSFVHRDLKLDNLLLTDKNQVKLSDVGVAKRERDISGTFCGTLLYLAPEVLDGGFYDSKADMYSFGIVLWEVWYAMTAFHVELSSRNQLQLLNDVRGGLRPSHVDGTREPWGLWRSVMMTCWDKEPQQRLTAEQSLQQLDNLRNLLHAAESKTTTSRPHPVAKPRRHKTQPTTKPRPAPRRNTPRQASVTFSAATEDGNVYFQQFDKTKQ